MKPIKRFGKVKIPKSWEIIGRKKLKTFIKTYPYLKRWFLQQIERLDSEWWKEKSKINALYIAGFITKSQKRYGFLVENRKQLSKNGVKLIERYVKELEDLKELEKEFD